MNCTLLMTWSPCCKFGGDKKVDALGIQYGKEIENSSSQILSSSSNKFNSHLVTNSWHGQGGLHGQNNIVTCLASFGFQMSSIDQSIERGFAQFHQAQFPIWKKHGDQEVQKNYYLLWSKSRLKHIMKLILIKKIQLDLFISRFKTNPIMKKY